MGFRSNHSWKCDFAECNTSGGGKWKIEPCLGSRNLVRKEEKKNIFSRLVIRRK